MTEKQIAAVKYLIFRSNMGTDATKRLLAFLLDASKGLTEQVSLTLIEGREGYSREEIKQMGVEVHDMQSSNGSLHLSEIMAAMGSEFSFSCHYGHYDGQLLNSTGGGDSPMRYTFWLATGRYGKSGKGVHLAPSRRELEMIDLSKPGLHPNLENLRLTSTIT